jgi:hypothetical protein
MWTPIIRGRSYVDTHDQRSDMAPPIRCGSDLDVDQMWTPMNGQTWTHIRKDVKCPPPL